MPGVLSRSRASVASPRTLVPCDQDDPGAHFCQRCRGDFADAGRAAGDNNCLPPHKRSRLSDWRQTPTRHRKCKTSIITEKMQRRMDPHQMQKRPTNDIQGLAALCQRPARAMPFPWARISDDCGKSRNHCCRTRQLALANANTFAPARTRHLREIPSCRPRNPARSAGRHASATACRAACDAKAAPSIRPALWRSHNKDSVRQTRLLAAGRSASPRPRRRTRSPSHRHPAMAVPRRLLSRSEFLGS